MDNKSWPMFPLDAQIHTEPLRICKSLIPYLPFEKQKNLSIVIKLYELISVIDHFSDTDVTNYPTSHFRESETWQTDLLTSIRSNLDPQNAYWVDIFFKFNDIKKILSSAQSGGLIAQAPSNTETPITSEGPKNFLDNISPMLDDQQKQFLNILSTVIK